MIFAFIKFLSHTDKFRQEMDQIHQFNSFYINIFCNNEINLPKSFLYPEFTQTVIFMILLKYNNAE